MCVCISSVESFLKGSQNPMLTGEFGFEKIATIGLEIGWKCEESSFPSSS